MPGVIETGVVSAIAEDGLQVRIDSGSGVGCASCGHCSMGAGEVMTMSGVADSFGANVGDTVEVELPQGARLRTSMLSYGLPVVALAVGYLAGFLLGSAVGIDPDDLGAVTAVLAAIATFVAARKSSVETVTEGRFRPKVRAIITPSANQQEMAVSTVGSDT